MNKFPPALTRAELHALARQSTPGSVERRLLWEIKRLQAVALRADQLLRSLGPAGGAARGIAVALQAELDAEACVREDREMRSGTKEPE